MGRDYSPVRAICIGSLLLAVGALWITVQELVLGTGSLSSTAPPVGAVGLFMAVLCVALTLRWLQKRWGVHRRELLIIYCMLVTFLPVGHRGSGTGSRASCCPCTNPPSTHRCPGTSCRAGPTWFATADLKMGWRTGMALRVRKRLHPRAA